MPEKTLSVSWNEGGDFAFRQWNCDKKMSQA